MNTFKRVLGFVIICFILGGLAVLLYTQGGWEAVLLTYGSYFGVIGLGLLVAWCFS